jgi:hypothetical protein
MDKLSVISFPLALFGVGVSLYYFVESQMSTDTKLDQILKGCKDMPKSDNEPPQLDKSQNMDSLKPTSQPDNKTTLSEEDKIIIHHLFERHRTSISSGDAIDLKLAQMIALNGLILSFILIKGDSLISSTTE